MCCLFSLTLRIRGTGVWLGSSKLTHAVKSDKRTAEHLVFSDAVLIFWSRRPIVVTIIKEKNILTTTNHSERETFRGTMCCQSTLICCFLRYRLSQIILAKIHIKLKAWFLNEWFLLLACICMYLYNLKIIFIKTFQRDTCELKVEANISVNRFLTNTFTSHKASLIT